jgi:hypothetical protein
MELLCDVGHVECPFSIFGDSVSLVHGRCTVCAKHIIGSKNCFRCIGRYSWVTRLKWKLVLVCLETVLVSVQDRCTVCAKCTIASEIVLDAPDGSPR